MARINLKENIWIEGFDNYLDAYRSWHINEFLKHGERECMYLGETSDISEPFLIEGKECKEKFCYIYKQITD